MRMARLGTVLGLFLLVLPACDSAALGPDVTSDASPPPMNQDGGAAADGGAFDRSETPSEPGICYDGVDNDDDGAMDCSDTGCVADDVCCVGSANCCSASASVDFMIPEACVDATFDECGLEARLTPFGAVAPNFEGGNLVPQGGTTYGGVALGPSLDPRAANVMLDATIHVPAARCTDCIDAAGVAFFESIPAAGERGVVRLGVLANGSRDEVQVIVADRVVAQEPLSASALTIRVTLLVDGTATISGIGDAPFALEDIELPVSLSPVVFGRTDNRAGEAAVGVTSARVTLNPCDVPSAIVRRIDPVLPASSTTWVPSTPLGRVAMINVGTDTRRLRGVFAHAGDLLGGGINGSGELVGEAGPPDPVMTPPAGFESLHDPWLFRNGDRVQLYFAAERPDGTRQILRASGGPGLDLTFGDGVEIGLPAEVRSADGPTVWPSQTETGFWHMVARVDTGIGIGELALLRSADEGFQFEWANGSLESSIVRSPDGNDAFAIHRDEVASPALVEINGTWRLYYSARRGGRWSIGLLVSSRGLAWRDLGPVLEGDGVGFDALGVLHPAPVVMPSGNLRLYYVGTTGSQNVLGLSGPAGTLGE